MEIKNIYNYILAHLAHLERNDLMTKTETSDIT